ncbi:xylulokinase [Helcobacillus massiliensis]|uniref:xylulokinase n=1 Tax=Helcobacillus massiliensis TaxID=521392 RepID=UPI0021A4CE5A|nr:xylulokinase [Helcobacillus massiliensis]MCT1557585.1 xylulokinase [Helcobacillus massiliensis]MCT2036810.1 xylulokinase [Helcobacillus massiliensis]MCT2332437.1 xylulokinase [Helcobacillus massiliensis]
MSLVLGIDSSTQSTKALLVDADSGEIVEERRAGHPDATEVDPREWLKALDDAAGPLLSRAQAVAVGGQQHGMVALDDTGTPVRNALLWNDTRSARTAQDLVEELGGPAAAAERTGSVHVASITSAKLRWMKDTEPENAARTHRVVLPHDWLNHHLDAAGGWFTDRGDASGTGYFSPRHNGWDDELQRHALGHDFAVPAIATTPFAAMGETREGGVIAPGTGDNMAAALGLGLTEGDVSLSVGTSGVAAMVSNKVPLDPSGAVNGFADATGRWLPLACTLNASRILDFGCSILAVGYDELSEMAMESAPGANGAVFIPYLDGERTPNRPDATGSFHGLTRSTTRNDMARAIIEGLVCSLADAVGFVEDASGSQANRILLIGGGSKSPAVRALAPAVLGKPIELPVEREYVALGAARQAAWALSGSQEPPAWNVGTTTVLEADHTPHVLEQYRDYRG